jgi:hypothetical protein
MTKCLKNYELNVKKAGSHSMHTASNGFGITEQCERIHVTWILIGFKYVC